ncbi:MAG: hypothetical protein AB1726_10700 [Planctomycetota bacterium]
MSSDPSFRLRSLPAATRAGLTGALLVLLLGVWAAVRHVEDHYQNRDSVPGMTLDDLRGAYHGIQRPAPFVTALQRGHPEELAPADRALLLGWLAGRRISEDYDNLDLGDRAPAEVIAAACLSCHARQATEGDDIGQEIPLEYWDDVQKAAFAVYVEGTPAEIMRISTHTHALALGCLAIVVAGLLLATRWPGLVRHGLAAVAGLALLADLGGMWLARIHADLVWLVVVGGAAFSISIVLAILAVLGELWLPAPARE